MKKKHYVAAALVSFFIMAGISNLGRGTEHPATRGKAYSGNPITFTCKLPNTEEDVSLQAKLPDGWKRNPAFGTVVFEPGDAEDFFEAPSIEMEVLCEGECKPEAIPGNILFYIQRLKAGWKTLATGNPEIDKLGTNVEIIKDEQSGDTRVFEVKLTYPEGVSAAMYPPRYWIYRFIHNPEVPFFILIRGKVPVNLANQFLSDVRAACLSVKN
jgi:hypothetical protein